MKRFILAVTLLLCSVPAFAQTYSIWAPTYTNTGIQTTSLGQYQIGTKFKSDVDGYVMAVRWYKSPSDSGTHAVAIFNSSGTLLGSASSTPNETASGWQVSFLPTPVAITANTDYYAIKHVPATPMAIVSNQAATDSPPLHSYAGADFISTSSTTTFSATPTHSITGYMVDVIFVKKTDARVCYPAQ